jgi:hypothetical protein
VCRLAIRKAVAGRATPSTHATPYPGPPERMTATLIIGLVVLVAILAGATGWLAGRRASRSDRGGDAVLPTDHEHLLDLLRRAHRAIVAIQLDADGALLTSKHPRGVAAALSDRGLATARLALANGHPAQLTDAPATVAAVHEGTAVALVFDREIGEDTAERALADAWRLAAGLAGVGQLAERASRESRASGWWCRRPSRPRRSRCVTRSCGTPTGLRDSCCAMRPRAPCTLRA